MPTDPKTTECVPHTRSHRIPIDQTDMTVVEDATGAPMFVAEEVGTALGYGDGDLRRLVGREWSDRLRPCDVTKLSGADLAPLKASGVVAPNASALVLLTESGLYRVLMLSGKPAALRLQEWLADDVLPALRKTGTYTAPGGQIDRLLQDQASARARGSWGAVASMHAVEERLRRNEREAAAKASRAQIAETEHVHGHRRAEMPPADVAEYLDGRTEVTTTGVLRATGRRGGQGDLMQCARWLRGMGFVKTRAHGSPVLWQRSAVGEAK